VRLIKGVDKGFSCSGNFYSTRNFLSLTGWGFFYINGKLRMENEK